MTDPTPNDPAPVSVEQDERRFTISERMIDFLCGAGEIDGYSFGNTRPDRTGAFWWRRDLQLDLSPVARSSHADGVRVAGQAILENMFSTYKARNGREVGIQSDDGEKVWMIHSDFIHALESALKASPAPTVAEIAQVAPHAQAEAECSKCHDSGYIEISSGGIWTGENVTVTRSLCDCACGDDARDQENRTGLHTPEQEKADD